MCSFPFHGEPAATDPEGKPIDLNAMGLPERRSVYAVAYDQIADHLAGGPTPHCTGQEAAVVHEVGMAAAESMATGRRIELPVRNRTRKIHSVGR
jgi:predicted dehydrogenase